MSFAAVLAVPGVEEACELRSSFGFMAFHGGNLERQTDLIAQQAAELSGASLYAVVQPDDLRQHYPSASVDPAFSPALEKFLAHCDVVIAVHGYGRHGRWDDILLGGQNRTLAQATAGELRASLAMVEPAGYRVVTDLDQIPKPLRGLHRNNPVNLPRLQGVQVELPPGVRGLTPQSTPYPSPFPPVAALIEGLASTARSWSQYSQGPPAPPGS